MCDNKDFNVFPPVVIGGPTGDYFIDAPVASSRWTEYALVMMSNGSGGVASVFVTGDDKPVQVVYDGSKTLSADAFLRGCAAQIPISTTMVFDSDAWFRVTHSQKRVFIRIDVSSGSCYVTLRFRNKLVTIVPGPAHTVHPDAAEQLHQERADKTKERLKSMGIPERIIDHG